MNYKRTRKYTVKKFVIITLLALCALTTFLIATSARTETADAWWKHNNSNPLSWLNTSHAIDTNGTHQVLARAAYAFVQPMFPNIFPAPNNSGGSVITRHADYPDNRERWGQAGISHMYYFPNPWTGGWNARTRFVYHYQQAVYRFRRNEKEPTANNIGAWGHLGAAIHFLSDLATPVHTGDWRAANSHNFDNSINDSNHLVFEAAGDRLVSDVRVRNFIFPSTPRSPFLHTLTINEMAGAVAEASFWAYHDNYASLHLAQAEAMVIHALGDAAVASANLLYKFAREVEDGLSFDPIAGTNNVSVRARQGAVLPVALNIPTTVCILGTTRTVTQIAPIAFPQFYGTITIPFTVTYIGHEAFWRMSSGSTVRVLGTYPPTLNRQAFRLTTVGNINIYIPSGTTQEFINAGWYFLPNLLEPHKIELSQTSHTFPSMVVGESLPAGLTISIFNIGRYATGVLTVSGHGPFFTISTATIFSIPRYGGNSFTISPADNIPAGEHNVTIRVGNNNASAYFSVNITVPEPWVYVFSTELCGGTLWEYVGVTSQLRIQLRVESGNMDYMWVYLNAGESKFVDFYHSQCCCSPWVFYIEFDGSYFGITSVNGAWIWVNYFVRVYRWVGPPSPQPEPIEWYWVYSGWLCCWRDVNMGENDGTIRVVFYMCCCTSSEAYAEIIIPFETSEYFTFDIGGWLHVTVLVHYGSWNLHLSLGTGVTIGFSVYRQV